jgi:hypothetical protein
VNSYPESQLQGYHSGYIEELAVPYDPTVPAAKVKKRFGRVRGRIISLVLTVVILLVIYFWQRASFPAGVWWIYGIIFGLSLLWLAFYVIGYVQARRELASVGQGIALRIGRAGVQAAAEFAPWPQITALRVLNGKLGRSARFRLEYVSDGGPRSVDVPMDQLPVLPATLDTTARAYSAGRWGVDLSSLDA